MRISVVVPALNEENYIEKTLRSLKKQTIPRKEYEIIVVDDASQDRTAKIAAKFADRVLKIERVSIGGVRDAGLRKSKAPLVAFTDADTIVPENWLEKILQGFRDKNTVAFYGNVGFDLESIDKEIVDTLFHLNIKVFKAMGIEYPPGANFAVRRVQAIKAGGFKKDMNTLEEVDLIKRLQKFGNITHDESLIVTTSARRIRVPTTTLPYFSGWFYYLVQGTTKNVRLEQVR